MEKNLFSSDYFMGKWLFGPFRLSCLFLKTKIPMTTARILDKTKKKQKNFFGFVGKKIKKSITVATEHRGHKFVCRARTRSTSYLRAITFGIHNDPRAIFDVHFTNVASAEIKAATIILTGHWQVLDFADFVRTSQGSLKKIYNITNFIFCLKLVTLLSLEALMVVCKQMRKIRSY